MILWSLERKWIQLYQKPRYKVLGEKKHMMLRPSFPAIYKQSQMPDASMISDLVVVVSDEWKNGDLIDWWTESCYWSGKIIQLLGNDKVQVNFCLFLCIYSPLLFLLMVLDRWYMNIYMEVPMQFRRRDVWKYFSCIWMQRAEDNH